MPRLCPIAVLLLLGACVAYTIKEHTWAGVADSGAPDTTTPDTTPPELLLFQVSDVPSWDQLTVHLTAGLS